MTRLYAHAGIDALVLAAMLLLLCLCYLHGQGVAALVALAVKGAQCGRWWHACSPSSRTYSVNAAPL